jgi:phosphoserine phosphatase
MSESFAASADQQRVLVTVTGPDTPGITAKLTSSLADKNVALLDVEQVVVQGHLILALLLGLDSATARGAPVLKDLLFAAKSLGLELDFRVLEGEERAPREELAELRRYAVTAIGDGFDATGLHVIAEVLAKKQANIENIRQLSDGSLVSVEVIVSLPGPVEEQGVALRRELLAAVADYDIDIAVQRETVTRRSKRLIVMDMDSTLISIECIDELARLHGVADRVEAITARAMAGELDFEQSLRERVALLEGLEHERVLGLSRDLPLTDGAEDLLYVLRALGYKTALVSGGFTFAANALKERLGIDYAYANQLEVAGGRLTGRVLDPIVGPQRKADLLDAIAQGEGISLEQTIAIGDGANDLGMLERAGLGIAFHAKPKLRQAADTTVTSGGLDRILYLLGLRAREVSEILSQRPR